MKSKYIGLAICALFILAMGCNSEPTEEEKKQEQLADSLVKSDQERIDSFKRANGLK